MLSMLNKFSDAILALFSYLLTFLAAVYPMPVYTAPVPVLPADYDINNTTVSNTFNSLLGSYVSSLFFNYLYLSRFLSVTWIQM